MSRPFPNSQTFGATMQGEVAIAASVVLAGHTFKRAVRVATTGNITIATDLNVGDTIDGITLVEGDRVLVWQQTTQSQNGVYIVGATPVRSHDFDASDEIVGALVSVTAGTTYGQRIFRNTNTSAVVVDTDAITYETQTGAVDSLSDVDDVSEEAPTEGEVLVFTGTEYEPRASGRHVHIIGEPFVGDGAQTVFYLANEAEIETVAAYVSGVRTVVTQDATETDKITFGAAPTAGSHLFDYLAVLA
jgi:hypothetical protein